MIVQQTRTQIKAEKVEVASASQSGSTVTLGTITRAQPFGDGTDFTGSGTAQSFAAGARVYMTINTHFAEQTALKDVANTFSDHQLITSTNELRFADTATAIWDDGTNLSFKDSANSTITLATIAAAAGADQKVGIDTGATAGFLGAASNDGVLRTGNGLSYTDGGDFVTIDTQILKDGSATELTISSGAVTLTSSAHTIDTESDAASDDLDTISGGADGNYLTLFAANDARTVVVKHGADNILTADNKDVYLDSDDKSILLRS
jgi:predicted ribosome-associated RNA-binding protein Tma20